VTQVKARDVRFLGKSGNWAAF